MGMSPTRRIKLSASLTTGQFVVCMLLHRCALPVLISIKANYGSAACLEYTTVASTTILTSTSSKTL